MSRYNNGPDILWLSANYVDVEGAAKPESFSYEDQGTNDVATIRIKDSLSSGDAVLISGRPERLVEIAKEILRTAELVMIQTMQSPELRRLYGITTPIADAERRPPLMTPGPVCQWYHSKREE